MDADHRRIGTHSAQLYYPIYQGTSPRKVAGLPWGEHALHASLTLLTVGLWLPIWHYRQHWGRSTTHAGGETTRDC